MIYHKCALTLPETDFYDGEWIVATVVVGDQNLPVSELLKDKQERQNQNNAKTRKKNPPPLKKSTYRGTNVHNTVLYEIVPNWRTRLASTQSERDNGNYKNQIIYDEASKQGAVPVRVRAHFWNDYIEPKNSNGISNNSTVNKSRKELVRLKTYFNTVNISRYRPNNRDQWYKDEPVN